MNGSLIAYFYICEISDDIYSRMKFETHRGYFGTWVSPSDSRFSPWHWKVLDCWVQSMSRGNVLPTDGILVCDYQDKPAEQVANTKTCSFQGIVEDELCNTTQGSWLYKVATQVVSSKNAISWGMVKLGSCNNPMEMSSPVNITYGRLVKAADDLCEILVKLGVCPGMPVGICMAMSPTTIALYLALSKVI